MTVVVTGASGHLGMNLVRALVAEKRRVRALVHINHKTLEGLGAETVQGNVSDVESLTRAFEGGRCRLITGRCNFLLKNDWPRVEKVNVSGTRNVIEACRRNGVKRLVHLRPSTPCIEPLDIPVNESRTLVEGAGIRLTTAPKLPGNGGFASNSRWFKCRDRRSDGCFRPYDYQPSYFGSLILMANGHMPALINGGLTG